jgi:hypothetical protein
VSNHYDDLDHDILTVGRPFAEPSTGLFDSAMFVSTLRKLAAPGLPAPDKDLAEHEQAVAAGQEATPEDAEALYAQGQPDTAGHLEGEFAVPVEQVVGTMAQIVSHELKLQLAYLFYGEMLRGLNRDLSEVFDEIAEDEINDAKYLLRRISVLIPGGVPIPVPPAPAPLHDPQQILEQMIAGEQQAIVLLKALRAQLGENPMKFTVEEMLSEEQSHLDRLWQYMPQDVPAKQASGVAKLAEAMAKLSGVTALRRGVAKLKELDKKSSAGAEPILVPSPGSEPIEQNLLREQQLQAQQSEAEKQDLMVRLQQTQQLVSQHQMAADQANQAAQQASQQAEQATQLSAVSQQQAMASSEAATAAQTQAAAQAEGKMRLSMRIQQLRQQLADLASQDPVAEEGMSHGGAPGPGAPMTQPQMAQQAAEQEQAAQAEQMAAEQEQAAQTGGSKAKKEVQQAQKAQQTAQVQTQQAQTAAQGA